MLNALRLGGTGFRAFVTLFAPIALVAIGCGGKPSVTTPGDQPTAGTGGSSGGTSGGGGTGGTGILPVPNGGQGDESEGGMTNQMPAVCGDGVLEAGELCDDGNTTDDDGCSADCSTVDPNYLCTEGQLCTRVVTCGNGVIEGDESCDDGNTDDGDGCSADCSSIDDGYACIKPGEPCVLLPVCGNSVREQGEQCDDGNTDDGDGCGSTCQLEDGYFCPPGDACVKIECGDGRRTPDEGCDDGNTKNGDGCSSQCTVEDGWLCGTSGCRPICGDGVVLGGEECDDDNNTSGDGCSGACKIEPFYTCTTDQPSVCSSTIVCGDGKVDPGEVCDPGAAGESACYATGALACKGYDTGRVNPPVCNNGVIEFGETCDGNVTGCTNCMADPGYACPAPNVCIKIPVCGDGQLQAGEECDLGVDNGPGCMGCKIQDGYFCSGEPSMCVAIVCGDGKIEPGEACDDKNTKSGDGCSADCSTVETGYKCVRPGLACVPLCGDGVIEGTEQCDIANPTATDTAACTKCRLNAGYTCGANGTGPCRQTVCGNGTPPTDPINSDAYIATAKAQAEPGEGCDDGNTVAGDGCGPTCQLEPKVTVGPSPTVALTCGDGLLTGSEQCDDGNTTDGDGCDHLCNVETGWSCNSTITYPPSVTMAVTHRDFKANGATGGHPHFENVNADNKGIAGAVCTNTNQATCGRLDNEGKPVTAGGFSSIPGGTAPSTSSARFATWYRDTNTLGFDVSVLHDTLQLTQVGAANSPIYDFSSSAYFPIDGRGFSDTCNEITNGCCNAGGDCVGHNFSFTTELRYFFQYQGGEKLIFRGDDDVWVFINGHLAVDVGGVHCAEVGQVVLGDEDSTCTLNGTDYTDNNPGGNFSITACGTTGDPPACDLSTAEQSDTTDSRFGLTKGGVYEIVLFHAERHTTQSNFRLTLQGFLAPRSTCSPVCGPNPTGQTPTVSVTPPEQCDDGSNNTATPTYGKCTAGTCTLGPYCGDGSKNGPEQCDNGTNLTQYGTSGCAPGCVTPPHCGDGVIQPDHEDCDNGAANQDGLYGGCTTQCKLGPYCGDGVVSNGEDCDTPGQFTTYGTAAHQCNYDCHYAPYCGDGIRNGAEQCDGGAGCGADCEFAAFCGDGLKEGSEQCDNGTFNQSPSDTQYGGCTTNCTNGPSCGDGTVQADDGEECDDGSKNKDNSYDGCTTSCLFGPHCGDGIRQGNEACDNGFNDDTYQYPGDTNACGADCKAPPSCGDGVVQSSFELCDNGSQNSDTTYDGCTTTCTWGPYCGDGVKNGPEKCDDGPNNTAYSADGKGCSYQCTTDVPYCGDGVRNGPEQCDDGTKNNMGEYGGCNADCTRAAYCGDEVVQRDNGEQCDDGPTGSLKCTPACKVRSEVPR